MLKITHHDLKHLLLILNKDEWKNDKSHTIMEMVAGMMEW